MNQAVTSPIDPSTHQRERALLNAARQVFTEQGYDNSSIAQIAQRAGVATGTVYLYFENKQQLLHHVLADFVRALTHDIEGNLEAISNPAARLRYVISRHLEALTAEPELSALFVREVHSPERGNASLIQSVKQRYASVLSRVLEEGIAAGALRDDIPMALARCIVFGGLEQLTLKTWSGRPYVDIATATDGLLRLLLKPDAGTLARDMPTQAVLDRLDQISKRLDSVGL